MAESEKLAAVRTSSGALRSLRSLGAWEHPDVASLHPGYADTTLDHAGRFLVGRQTSLWGQLVNQVRQMLTKASEQIVHAQPALPAQCIERIAAERIRQILGRDLFIRTGADPRSSDTAVSAVLQFFDDVSEAAAQHAAGGGAAEHAAQSAGEEVTQAAAGPAASAGRHSAWFAAEQPAEDVVEPTARSAGTHRAAGRERPPSSAGRRSLTAAALERLVGKKPEQRHHDRRHAAATTAARLALAARAIHHTGKNILQSHICLLWCLPPASRFIRNEDEVTRSAATLCAGAMQAQPAMAH